MNQSGYIPTLDGWRALAICLVLVHHLSDGSIHFILIGSGPIGVQVFFALSGFLITTRLIKEHELRGHISLWMFYVRRAFRILPAAGTYLLTIAMLASTGIVDGVSVRELVAAAAFGRNYVPGSWLTQHYWSLAVEEHFYLLFPLLLVSIGPRIARPSLIAFALLVAVWREVEKRHGFATDLLPPGVSPFCRTDMCADGLLWGCWTALAYRRRPTLFAHSPTAPLLVLAALTIIILAATATFRVPHLITAFVLPLGIVATAANPRLYISRVLEWQAVRVIGRYSYSLYLWQQLFTLLTWPWNILPAVTAAVLSYRLVERPLVRVGHQLTCPGTTRHDVLQLPAQLHPVVSVPEAEPHSAPHPARLRGDIDSAGST